MMLEIVSYPSPVLKKNCDNVIDYRNVQKLIDDMAETMYAHGGVGLAAPQVSVSTRVIVTDWACDGEHFCSFINPKITWFSPERLTELEGCLSIPGVIVPVLRSVSCDVMYDDVSGMKRNARLTGTLAKIVQHEVDHLDGVVIVDKLGKLAKRTALKTVTKNREDNRDKT